MCWSSARDDEHRWPGAFLTAIAEGKYTLHSDLPGDRAAAFRDEWMAHLAGIVEYAPVPVTLPSWPSRRAKVISMFG
ncbi:MAG: hypothetical protein U0R19_15650 [Bryobacteraceae bacterium]